MKKNLIFTFLILIATHAQSQIIFFHTGKTLSNFLYQDSNGNKLEDLKGANENSLAVGGRYSVNQSPFHVSGYATYHKYGAEGSNNEIGNYYKWDVTYLGINLAIDYEFFQPSLNMNKQEGFSVYPKLATSAEFLLNGTQYLNNEVFDLQGVEEFDKPLYFVKAGIGTNYYISKKLKLYLEYMYGQSFLIGNYKNEEQLRITTHTLSVGIAVNLFFINE